MHNTLNLFPFTTRATRRLLFAAPTAAEPRSFNMPKNDVQHLDLSANARTPERRLKSLLCEDGARVCVAVGMGGVGKTMALCALGRDPDVWMAFGDGVWFIQLGQDASLDYLHAELRRLAVEACSLQFAARFSEMISERGGDVAAVVALVREMQKLRFLLVFDDVWGENEVYAIVRRVVDAVSASSGRLRMLISTRERAVAQRPLTNSVVDVNPKEPHGIVARRILCIHAGANPDSLPDPSTDPGKAIEDILEKCAGLPVAIAVAGCAVRANMRDAHDEADRVLSWAVFRDSLRTSPVRLGREGSSQHEQGLFTCIAVSMRRIEGKWPKDAAVRPNDVLQSLCIFPKQTWIPLETLRRTWGTKPGYAEVYLEVLSDYSIVSRSHENKKLRLRAHDLVLDYCMLLAGENRVFAGWHARLVEGYSHDLDRVEGEEVACMNWWSEKLSEDSYIRSNIVRHLLECGKRDEALRLICDYRWVQLLNGDRNRLPFQQCISDLERVEQHMSDGFDMVRKLQREVALLRETMELCVYACARHRAECTFQLCGRLASFESPSELFARCLWSIMTHSSGPWVKPAPGVLRGAGSSLKGTVPVSFNVHSMELGVEANELVLGGDGGEVAVMDLRNGVLRWEATGHKARVTGLEVNRRSGEVFSCSIDGTIAVWRDGTRLQQYHPFGWWGKDGVACMKLLHQLGLIACGSDEGKLKLIDMRTGHIMWAMSGHTRGVTSFAVHEDRDLLVSASWDHTIQRWDARSGQKIGEPLRGHAAAVSCLAVGRQGNFIASGSRDETVRIWNTEEGVEVCNPLSCESGFVTAVLFNPAGDVLFSSGYNEILVWDVSTPQYGVPMKHKLSHEIAGVTSLCLSRDSEDLIAASEFKRNIFVVRAYPKLHTQDNCSSERFLAGDIKVFGISQDGKTMATCSKDSRRTIHIRRVSDVSAGNDSVLASCPVTEVDWVGQVAVSNDTQLVAYNQRWRGPIVYVARVSTGKVVHELKQLSEWARNLEEHGMMCSGKLISRIAFDREDAVLTAEARLQRLSDGKWLAKLIQWRISNGQSASEQCSSAFIQVKRFLPMHSTPCLSIKEVDKGPDPFENEVRISEQSRTIIGGTLEATPTSFHYEGTANRLWIARSSTGLQFVDLINGPVRHLATELPVLPVLPRSSLQLFPPGSNSRNTQSSKKYTVFISYSGPDRPLADWLHLKLTSMGITVFAAKSEIRVGDISAKVMIEAMESADVIIIIVSPEYAAKKWTMQELLCFQMRTQEAESKGERGPIIIPLYFRMSPGSCKSPAIMYTKDEEGYNVFEKYKFFDRLSQVRVEDMQGAMRWLGGYQGIENLEQVPNKPRTGQSEEEWRGELHGLLENVLVETGKALMSLGKRVAGVDKTTEAKPLGGGQGSTF